MNPHGQSLPGTPKGSSEDATSSFPSLEMRSDEDLDAMTTRDLRNQFEDVSNVFDFELALTGDPASRVQAWDGEPPSAETQTAADIPERVDALLGDRVPVVDPPGAAPVRRGGLGRGLDALLPEVDRDRVPVQLRGSSESPALSVRRVAVVESRDVVTVEIEDGAGKVHTAEVGSSGSIDDAVLEAAAALSGALTGVTLRIGELSIAGVRIVVVAAETEDRRGAGACPVEFGRPFAVARATRQALESLA